MIFGLGKEIAVTHRVLEREIARNLGTPELLVSFTLIFDRQGAVIRLPAPGSFEPDNLPPEETGDIIGQGKSSEDAIADACRKHFVASCYRNQPRYIARFALDTSH